MNVKIAKGNFAKRQFKIDNVYCIATKGYKNHPEVKNQDTCKCPECKAKRVPTEEQRILK